MILHWKIAFTSLKYSFHSNPKSRCFVLVHFQSHNAPNLPPLHILEMGYADEHGNKHSRVLSIKMALNDCMDIHMSVNICINMQAGHIPTGRWSNLFFIILGFSFSKKIGVDLVLDPMQRQPTSLFFISLIANPLQVTILRTQNIYLLR